MTDTALASQAQPKHTPVAKRERLSPQARAAVEAMVWQGLARREAAAAAGMTDQGLYQALRKPLVKALYLSELQVLRDSEKAKSFHTLCDVRDQTENHIARVQAVKAMYPNEEIVANRATEQSVAGVVIRVINIVQNKQQDVADISVNPHPISTYQNSMSLTEPNDIKQIDHEPR